MHGQLKKDKNENCLWNPSTKSSVEILQEFEEAIEDDTGRGAQHIFLEFLHVCDRARVSGARKLKPSAEFHPTDHFA
jgi:hypothetical protein